MFIILSQLKFGPFQYSSVVGGFQPLSCVPPWSALQASRLSLWVPTDEFSYLAFEVSLLGLGCALFCFLLTRAQTLLFQTQGLSQ